MGDTVIGVRVTAQDGTTQTYTVTVTRWVSMLASCEPDNVWCATLTVGKPRIPVTAGAPRGYCAHGAGPTLCDYGALDVDGFALDQTGYTVESVRWGGGNF